MSVHFPPPYTPLPQLQAQMRQAGYAALAPDAVAALAGVSLAELQALQGEWDGLPPDTWLRDGGRYRRRRHGCFIADADRLKPVAHRAHWQSTDYNALHGGIARWFEPLTPRLTAQPAFERLVLALGGVATALSAVTRWHVEVHPFRIDTTDGIGRPTPEGAHRDGVDYVAVVLVARVGMKGGETRVFEADGPQGQRFTLAAPWSLLLMDDARMIHETTPIQPEQADVPGHRDTLVITWRRGDFQGED